jgi:hypothetical protein
MTALREIVMTVRREVSWMTALREIVMTVRREK